MTATLGLVILDYGDSKDSVLQMSRMAFSSCSLLRLESYPTDGQKHGHPDGKHIQSTFNSPSTFGKLTTSLVNVSLKFSKVKI